LIILASAVVLNGRNGHFVMYLSNKTKRKP